jgi:hypothetical protein
MCKNTMEEHNSRSKQYEQGVLLAKLWESFERAQGVGKVYVQDCSTHNNGTSAASIEDRADHNRETLPWWSILIVVHRYLVETGRIGYTNQQTPPLVGTPAVLYSEERMGWPISTEKPYL